MAIAMLITYILLMIGSSYALYASYIRHGDLSNRVEQTLMEGGSSQVILGELKKHLLEEKMVMSASFLILILSMFLLNRKEYLLKSMEREDKSLQKLLLEIRNYSEFKNRAEEFKESIQHKNTSELHLLISEMIEEIYEMKELADEANRTKSLFLANMSHEIRTPLNGIVGFTKILNSTNLDNEQEEFVQVIRKSSEDLISIVNDILDISKMESGNIELEEASFSPIEEFENVIETYAVNASKKEIDFSLWIDPILSYQTLRGDATKIKQVLVNLISNAVKFTDKNGKIDIRIDRVEPQKSLINSKKEAINFSVKDTGIGISEEQKDKVFEVFTQADSSTSRKYGGTGLGLAISSKLVNLLGGALILHSEVGQGSTFSFTLEFPIESMDKKVNFDAHRIAIFSPKEIEMKHSNRYLEDYLTSYKEISIVRFNDHKACLNNKIPFDVLYIHCSHIKKDRLTQLIDRYHHQTQIILVTQLHQRDVVADLSTKFTSVLYEPITFSKVEKSVKNILEKEREQFKSKEIKIEKSREESDYNGIKSLVVDDNIINQKMIVHTLKGLGIESDVAENGKIAFEMRIKNTYDIIFMDIQMPVMNGVDATHAILEYEEENGLKHIPIVAVTANALKGDRERFLAEGLDDYVSKPIQLNKFIEVLDKFCPNERGEKKMVINKDILLFKETMMESKIIGAILEKMGYSVDTAKDIEELKQGINRGVYRSILLDRVRSDIEYSSLTKQITLQKIPTLLFVENKNKVSTSELEKYTYVANKVTDYAYIKEKVDSMMELNTLNTAVA